MIDFASSLLALLFMMLSTQAQAQTFEIVGGDTINRVDENGFKQGKWLISNKQKNLPGYGADALVEETNFKDNKKEGLRRQYYPDGKLKSEVTFVSNVPKGYSKTYFSNGTVSEEGYWKNGGWDGAYKYYYENGNLSYEWNFVNGKRQGEQKYYYPNGKLNYIGNWKDGAESGILKEYNDSGLLVAEKNFNGGKLDEATTKYYQIPQVDKSINISTTTTASSQDAGSNVGVFSGNGYFKLKNKNGQPAREGTFVNGQLLDGKQFHYGADGGLIRTIIYKDGKILQTIEEK